MKENEQRITKSSILPKDLESFIPDMDSIYLLDTFFTRYGRIAYVSLYKQAVSKMTELEQQALYQQELGQENEIAISLGGIGPEMFDRDLFDPNVSATDILINEEVYSSIEETRKQAMENPTLHTYITKLSTIFEKLIDMKDYRQLGDFTNKYQGYISQILDRPEYEEASEYQVQELLNRRRSAVDDSNFSSFSQN